MEEHQYNQLFNYLNNQSYPSIFNQTQQHKLTVLSKHYFIKHNLLYKINKNNSNNPIRVLKRVELKPALYMFHNDSTAAYNSKEKMMEKIKK